MTWIVRTYDITLISGFNQHNQQKVALEKVFESKSEAERYRTKVNYHDLRFT